MQKILPKMKSNMCHSFYRGRGFQIGKLCNLAGIPEVDQQRRKSDRGPLHRDWPGPMP